jgi:hypothetical protein
MSKSKTQATPRPTWLLPAVVIGLGALLVALALLLTRGSQTDGAPRLAVAKDSYDYGDVRFETPVETVIQVQNVGKQPLEILGEPRVQLVQGC